MYAVIRAGGRQYKVSPGDRIAVDLLAKDSGEEVTYTPLLVIPDSGQPVTGDACGEWLVRAVVVGRVKDRKITGFKYKPKTGYRRRWGHRQQYSLLEIRAVGDRTYDPGEPESSDEEAEEAADG